MIFSFFWDKGTPTDFNYEILEKFIREDWAEQFKRDRFDIARPGQVDYHFTLTLNDAMGKAIKEEDLFFRVCVINGQTQLRLWDKAKMEYVPFRLFDQLSPAYYRVLIENNLLKLCKDIIEGINSNV